jgi:predicted TIM-barrel fold metal-dependent hydrolase
MNVDADTHVLETEKAFEYLAENEKQFKPAVVSVNGEHQSGIPNGGSSDYWLIDGQLYGKHDLGYIESVSDEIVHGTLDISNPTARLAAMDSQGVDTAVIYPSLLLITAIANADIEMALARSYNRWLADLCSTAPERLKFVAVVCPRRIEASVKELKWAKENGACGVLLRGFEGDATPDQPELDALLRAACDLDMPICIHIGNGSPLFRQIKVGQPGVRNRFLNRAPTLIAYSALLLGDAHQQYPGLRFAIVEAGSSWLPFLSVMTLSARYSEDKAAVVREALVEHRIYVTCEEHEDLPAILPYAGDDNLVIGSDFGHPGDVADSIHVQNTFMAREDIEDDVKSRIMSANARALYGI